MECKLRGREAVSTRANEDNIRRFLPERLDREAAAFHQIAKIEKTLSAPGETGD